MVTCYVLCTILVALSSKVPIRNFRPECNQIQIRNYGIWLHHNRKFQIGTFNNRATISSRNFRTLMSGGNLPGFLNCFSRTMVKSSESELLNMVRLYLIVGTFDHCATVSYTWNFLTTVLLKKVSKNPYQWWLNTLEKN